MSSSSRIRGALALAAALSAATVTLVPAASPGGGVGASPALKASCPASLVPGGHDYHGLVLVKCNFTGLDLTGANFSGSTLTAVVFIRAFLGGADFSGATFADSGNATLPTDFTFANLTNAKFVGAKFNGTTYLTYATLTCADFSSPDAGTTDLSNGNAIFGDSPLDIDTKQCRPKFRGTTMNCEFVAQWNLLDMSNAKIAACAEQLQTVFGQPGHDFSGGIFTGVVFDNLNLSGSKWQGAVLENARFAGATLDGATGWSTSEGGPPVRLAGAVFSDASVKNVDFTYAQLYGALFTRANLENSRLQNALLTNNPKGTPPIDNVSNFDYAHLKNVDLSNAKLDSASFVGANFYGSYNVLNHGPPAGFPCVAKTPTNSCGNTRVTGFTCSCATARGANLTKANFTGAFLYGTDFGGSDTTIDGTVFSNAVLVAANFNGATFSVDTVEGGAPPAFQGAYLQGADFTGAQLKNTLLSGAYVDFRGGGNKMQVLLDGNHTVFKGWKAQSAKVCVRVDYAGVTKVPTNTPTMTCPDGTTYPNPNGGCGRTAPPQSSRWRSLIDIANVNPPGFYVNKPTFGNANQSDPKCNAAKVDDDW